MCPRSTSPCGTPSTRGWPAGTPVDTALAIRQWQLLRNAYRSLGHAVQLIDGHPDLPDMVFAANGATVIGGTVLGARFRHPERAAEGPAYLDWFRRQRLPRGARAAPGQRG